jgi:hypothetical protein
MKLTLKETHMSFSLFKPGLRSRRLGFRAATGTALFALLVAGILTTLVGGAAAAATPVGLGTAGGYAILAGSGMTNTGPSTIAGDVGSSPTHSETGFARCPGPADCVVLNGTNHNAPDPNDLATQNAQADLITAYNAAAGEGPTSPISDISNQSLDPGVYNSGSTILLNGALTLNAHGDSNAVFVFQAGSGLTTGSASSVNLINGARSCNVFWQIGSSAVLGTGSTFRGSILALTDIHVPTGVTIIGRLLARNGAVTLDTDTISRPSCNAPTSTDTVAATDTTTAAATTAATTTAAVTTATAATTTATTATTPTPTTTTPPTTTVAPASKPAAPPPPPKPLPPITHVGLTG